MVNMKIHSTLLRVQNHAMICGRQTSLKTWFLLSQSSGYAWGNQINSDGTSEEQWLLSGAEIQVHSGQASWVSLELTPKEKNKNLERETGEARTFQQKEMASDVAVVVTHMVYLSWPNKTCLITHWPKITLEVWLFRILFLTKAPLKIQSHRGKFVYDLTYTLVCIS